MDIEQYADIIGSDIVITRYANQDGRYTASFENCEIMDGGLLLGEYGNSYTALGAINDYTGKISKKRIVFNAMKENRVEYNVPVLEETK